MESNLLQCCLSSISLKLKAEFPSNGKDNLYYSTNIGLISYMCEASGNYSNVK